MWESGIQRAMEGVGREQMGIELSWSHSAEIQHHYLF